MARDLRNHIRKCGCCKKFEAAPPVAPLRPLTCSGPGELLHVDFTSIEETAPLHEEPVIAGIHSHTYYSTIWKRISAKYFLLEFILTTAFYWFLPCRDLLPVTLLFAYVFPGFLVPRCALSFGEYL